MSKLIPINERMRACRIACNLTQKEVADMLNVNRSTYSYYESARSEPSLDTLDKLSIIYKVPLHQLLGSEPMPIRVADHSPESAGSANTDLEDRMYINLLSKDERFLILKFRTLSKKQQEEFLYSFGFPQDNGSSKKKN